MKLFIVSQPGLTAWDCVKSGPGAKDIIQLNRRRTLPVGQAGRANAQGLVETWLERNTAVSGMEIPADKPE